MPLVQYAACHKSYPFQEKFPAIVIWDSSIISRFVSIGLHARIQEFSSGGASRFICHKKLKKISDNVFLWVFLVLNLFYRSPMVNFKENCNFPRFQRGSIIFSGGRGPTFYRGGEQLFIPFTHITCVYSRGTRPLAALPCNIWINWMLLQKLDIRKSFQF